MYYQSHRRELGVGLYSQHLGDLSQEDNEFEASLGDSMKSCLRKTRGKITEDTCIKVIISSK